MNRRDVLKRAGQSAASLGVLGTAVAGTASAGDCGTWVDGWNGGYFTTRPYSDCDGNHWNRGAYDVHGSHPSFGNSEFHLHIPGWQTPRSEGKEKACGTAYYVNHTNDYDNDVVLFDWKSDCGNCDWWRLWECSHSFEVAKTNAWYDAERLKHLLHAHRKAGGDPPTISTHSMGGRVLLNALWFLQADSDTKYGRYIKSAHLYATAEDHDKVIDGRRATGIWRNTEVTWNIYNPDDDALDKYDAQSTEEPLGHVNQWSKACNFDSLKWREGGDHSYGKYIRSNTDKMVHQMIYTPSYRRWLVDHC